MLTRLFDIVCHKCGPGTEPEISAVIAWYPASSQYQYILVIECPACDEVEIIVKQALVKAGPAPPMKRRD